MALKIYKKSLLVWQFIDELLGEFIPSAFSIDTLNNKVTIVYKAGANSRTFNLVDVELYDIGEISPYPTFLNTTAFMQKLEDMACPCFPEFISNSLLSKNLTNYENATLPILDDDKIIIFQSGVPKIVNKSEIGGNVLKTQTFSLTRDWLTATLDRVYYINFNNNTIEFKPVGVNNTVIDSLTGRNVGMAVAPYNCVIKKAILTTRNTGAFVGKFGVGSGKLDTSLAFPFAMTNRIVHLDNEIVSLTYVMNEYVFDVVDGLTILAGEIISPSLYFTSQVQTTKNGVTIQIEIEEVI